VGAEVLGQLDRDRADAAGAGVDEHPVARSHVRLLDQRLPCSEGDQRQRCGLGHRQTGWLSRHLVLLDGDQLR
jgi:hypothetical protein